MNFVFAHSLTKNGLSVVRIVSISRDNEIKSDEIDVMELKKSSYCNSEETITFQMVVEIQKRKGCSLRKVMEEKCGKEEIESHGF